jgi:hypothetical protein
VYAYRQRWTCSLVVWPGHYTYFAGSYKEDSCSAKKGSIESGEEEGGGT